MVFDFEDDNYENIFSEAITINKYTSQGFEFSSDHKTLLMAPKDIIEFEVPDFVTTIGPSAFKGCKMLERIVLHNSIRNIAKDAFEYCSALKTFELSGSIDCIRQCPKYCVNEKTGFRYNLLYLNSVFKYKNKLVHNQTPIVNWLCPFLLNFH
jgi:hypothetical protein